MAYSQVTMVRNASLEFCTTITQAIIIIALLSKNNVKPKFSLVNLHCISAFSILDFPLHYFSFFYNQTNNSDSFDLDVPKWDLCLPGLTIQLVFHKVMWSTKSRRDETLIRSKQQLNNTRTLHCWHNPLFPAIPPVKIHWKRWQNCSTHHSRYRCGLTLKIGLLDYARLPVHGGNLKLSDHFLQPRYPDYARMEDCSF